MKEFLIEYGLTMAWGCLALSFLCSIALIVIPLERKKKNEDKEQCDLQ